MSPGYNFYNFPRGTSNHGGIAVIYKASLNFKITKLNYDFVTFEYASVNDPINGIQYIIVYRPPPSAKNRLLLSDYLNEFEDFLGEISLFPQKVVMLGDFNIHVNLPSKPEVKRFLACVEANGFQQHVMKPTHIHGNTLDLILSRPSDNLIQSTDVHNNGMSPDHFMVLCDVNCSKPSLTKKMVKCRNFKAIDRDKFVSDLCNSLNDMTPDAVCDVYIHDYDTKISTILNVHAPETTKARTIRPRYPWYNDNIKDQRKVRRRLERKWRKHGSLVDKQAYLEQKSYVNGLIETAKKEFYHDKLASADAKGIFQTVNTLLNKSQKPLPSCDSTQTLCNQFAEFFESKVAKIRDGLDQESLDHHDLESNMCSSSLTDFECVSEDEVLKLVMQCPTKTCKLDIIPTWLLKEHSEVFARCLTVIINKSLSEGAFPKSLGQAIITPVLKTIS
ncbi:uncharacterized protein [Amphiura filiformis]|uniref:uncharacterized protein n=1 Tax=Amphiura filiformis TaxID=82378 RepID=UPI003B21B2D0